MFKGFADGGIGGGCSQESVKDGAGGFNRLDADEGVFTNDVLDVIIEHEV